MSPRSSVFGVFLLVSSIVLRCLGPSLLIAFGFSGFSQWLCHALGKGGHVLEPDFPSYSQYYKTQCIPLCFGNLDFGKKSRFENKLAVFRKDLKV